MKSWHKILRTEIHKIDLNLVFLKAAQNGKKKISQASNVQLDITLVLLRKNKLTNVFIHSLILYRVFVLVRWLYLAWFTKQNETKAKEKFLPRRSYIFPLLKLTATTKHDIYKYSSHSWIDNWQLLKNKKIESKKITRYEFTILKRKQEKQFFFAPLAIAYYSLIIFRFLTFGKKRPIFRRRKKCFDCSTQFHNEWWFLFCVEENHITLWPAQQKEGKATFPPQIYLWIVPSFFRALICIPFVLYYVKLFPWPG